MKELVEESLKVLNLALHDQIDFEYVCKQTLKTAGGNYNMRQIRLDRVTERRILTEQTIEKLNKYLGELDGNQENR